MKYVIDYEERIVRTNSVTIEVDNEEEGEAIECQLESEANDWNHPDDIFCELENLGANVVERSYGAEAVEYEIA